MLELFIHIYSYAHGIVIQEAEADAVIQSRDFPQIPKSHKRTVQPQIKELLPCFAKDKAEPVLNVMRSNPEIYDATYIGFSDFMWLFCRKNNRERLHNVQSWAGWLSSTSQIHESSDAEQKCSTFDYMPPVFFPITENVTIQHVLEISQKATQDVGQSYMIVTFDLDVAQKAYSTRSSKEHHGSPFNKH